MTDNAMIITDNQGFILDCNEHIEAMFNMPRVSLVNRHITEYINEFKILGVLKAEIPYKFFANTLRNIIFKETLEVSIKPYHDNEDIGGMVVSIQRHHNSIKANEAESIQTVSKAFDFIIGQSDSIKIVKKLASVASCGNSTILFTGESGTGKELFAQAVHNAGNRRKGPFVSINCTAIPADLIEAELFGYEEGAFTGAGKNGRIGKFEAANDGTIFLDEIGDMPMNLQVKLLHVLQNKSFTRVGSSNELLTNARVIAATNQNLEDGMKAGKFREDLYYRLNVIPIDIPPLRERQGDIKLLMDYYLDYYNVQLVKAIHGFVDEVKLLFANYQWPGNIRELKNAIEYSVNMNSGSWIDMDSIPMQIKNSKSIDCSYRSLKVQAEEYEKRIVSQRINSYRSMGFSVEEIIEKLGISKATFYRKCGPLFNNIGDRESLA